MELIKKECLKDFRDWYNSAPTNDDGIAFTNKDVEDKINSYPLVTKQEIAKPLFDEFKEKLSKWLYHNSESVCGDSMIDIYYLEGHIDEILYEMGIIGEAEDGENNN